MKVHESWQDFLEQEKPAQDRMFALTTKGTGTLVKSKFHELSYWRIRDNPGPLASSFYLQAESPVV
jgi:tRNA(Leu) C34 or U34 (ribose-2'-O)-methylase TrmL